MVAPKCKGRLVGFENKLQGLLRVEASIRERGIHGHSQKSRDQYTAIEYRGTSLMRKRPPPLDPRRTLGMSLR